MSQHGQVSVYIAFSIMFFLTLFLFFSGWAGTLAGLSTESKEDFLAALESRLAENRRDISERNGIELPKQGA